MSFLLVICENGLNRDENVLRALLGNRELRVLKADGETLTDRSARLVEREFSRRRERFSLVLHRDADELRWRDREATVVEWFRRHRLSRYVAALHPLVPEPCVERWLCLGEELQPRRRRSKTTRPCDPWKLAWESAAKPEHLRLKTAVERLRQSPPPELRAFLDGLMTTPQ